MFPLILLISLVISLSQAVGPDGKCRVLVLRGGGTKGAYAVGALRGIYKTLDPVEI